MRYAAGRALLRVLLGRCLGIGPAEVRFRYERYGKPALDGADLFFNMSRSGGYALYAVTREREIGVDIEEIRDIPEMDRIAGSHFSGAELRHYCSKSGWIKRQAFFQLWTRKEALLKAVGTGLAGTVDAVHVSAESAERTGVFSLRSGAGEQSEWALCDLSGPSGFAMAAAVAATGRLHLRVQVLRSDSGDGGAQPVEPGCQDRNACLACESRTQMIQCTP